MLDVANMASVVPRPDERSNVMGNSEDSSAVEPAVLADDELEAVNGGLVVNSIIAILIGMLVPDMPKRSY